jgi:hypothetical protein
VLFRVDSEIENYDVAPDGTPQSPIRVILNWTAGLPVQK